MNLTCRLMTQQETLYGIALTLTPALSLLNMRALYDEMGSFTAIYENRNDMKSVCASAGQRTLEALAGMDTRLARAEEEMLFAEKGGVRIIGLSDDDYPQRLKLCPDSPVLLYYRGNASLNAEHIVSMVGTRQITESGKDFCRTFISDLKRLCPDTLVVSGLAYGVDVHCHREALQNGLPTVGVVAHGLEQIYPRSHRQTAVDMVSNGGILTEYVHGTAIDKRNFVQRNRIVAGITNATVVVESASKGGSLITAEIANGYSREVFAVPGRVTDPYSAGCNRLIAEDRAVLLTDAEQFVNYMGWQTDAERKAVLAGGVQQDLFAEMSLSEEERRVVDCMTVGENEPINLLVAKTGMSVAQLSSLFFTLEMKNMVKPVVGGCYRRLQ